MFGSVLSPRPCASSRVFRLSSQLVRVSGLLVAACVCLLAFAPGAVAQSAHFSGITSQVGSGFGYPLGVAVDASGDVFVADASNNATTIKEIEAGTGGNAAGQVSAGSTIVQVGSGFNNPSGVAVDASGDVFVADTGNNAVKEIVAANGQVSSTSTVKTVGSGFSGPMSVAVDGAGDVFVADKGNNAVKEIVAANGQVSSSSTVNTVGSAFSTPEGVAVDGSGNVFVADTGNNAVKEIVAVNGQVSATSTVNTVGSGFSGPEGVAVDEGGNVFVADANNGAVKEVVAGTGGDAAGLVSSASTILTLGGLPLGSYPVSVAVDGRGDVFATDSSYIAVDEIEAKAVSFGSVNVNTSTPITETLTFTIDGVSTGNTLGAPVVLTAGATGKDFTDAGTGTCTTNGTTHAYAAGGTCTVVVAFKPLLPGQRLGAVQLMSSSGAVLATANVYGTGLAPLVTFPGSTAVTSVGSGFNNPAGVAVDGSGDVFVADSSNNAVKEIVAVNGQVSSSSTIKTVGNGFSNPSGVAVDGGGDVFVVDFSHNAVKEIVAVNGQVSSASTVVQVGSGFNYPNGVAVDGSGDVFVADTSNNAVKEILAVNGQISSSSTVKTVGSGFKDPYGVAVDGSGDVFVADTINNAVKEIVAGTGGNDAGQVSSASTVLTISSGGPSAPYAVAVDGSGDVFVVDTSDNTVEEIVAGTGGNAQGQVSAASTVVQVGSGFNYPNGVALDGSGDVFVADLKNNAVKQVSLATPPSLNFGSAPINSSTAMTMTVSNEGTANLDLIVPTTGLNPSVSANFSYDSSSTCPQLDTTSTSATLAPGASCALVLDFTPTAVNSFTGSATATDNNLNAAAPGYTTQTISLSGTGTVQGKSAQTITFPALTASVIYGAAPVTLAATASSGLAVSYTVTGPASVSGTTLTFTGAGTVVVTASQIGNTTYNAATPVSQTITVSKATLGQNGLANITLTSAPNSSISGQTVTFTATVPSGATGTVSFMNGTTSLGTGTISGTTATYATNTLAVGTYSVTAVYSGDANYNTATSAVDSQIVLAANAPDFTLALTSSASQTVGGVNAAYYTVQVAPTGSAYPGPVSFTVTGLPPQSTATFSPATVAANAGPTTSTLSISVITESAMNKGEDRGAPIALAVLLLPLATFKRVRKNGRRYLLLFVVLLGGMAATTGLSGCFEASPAVPQTYNLTITGTSGTLQHSVKATLIVVK